MNIADSQRIARTMNFGMALDAPQEGEWGLTIAESHIAACANAGFTAIRIPVQWVTRQAPKPLYTVHAETLRRLDQLIALAHQYKLTVIITDHPDEPLMADPPAHQERFMSLWRQLAEHWQGLEDEAVYFEPLSEPHGAMSEQWNKTCAAVLATIRVTNPTRPVIVGPPDFNRADRLDQLHLPHDEHSIVSFHYYLPIPFTMQGEEYLRDIVPIETIRSWVGTQWSTDSDEWKKSQAVFKAVQDWATTHDRPIFLGEFGVTDHADSASKLAWITAHRRLAEQCGFSWGYWTFGAAFSAYDVSADRWRPGVLKALFGDMTAHRDR